MTTPFDLIEVAIVAGPSRGIGKAPAELPKTSRERSMYQGTSTSLGATGG